jgi:hypothetical protein
MQARTLQEIADDAANRKPPVRFDEANLNLDEAMEVVMDRFKDMIKVCGGYGSSIRMWICVWHHAYVGWLHGRHVPRVCFCLAVCRRARR